MASFQRAAIVFFLGILALFLQGTVFKSLLPPIFVPNFILIIAVFIAFYEVTPFGGALVFLLGLEFDVAAGELLGPWAGAFIVVFGILASISQRVFVESPLAVCLAVLCSSLVSNIVYVILTYKFLDTAAQLGLRLIVEAIVTAAVAPFVFKCCKLLLPRRGGYTSGRSSAVFS